jgi:hypothetical protein
MYEISKAGITNITNTDKICSKHKVINELLSKNSSEFGVSLVMLIPKIKMIGSTAQIKIIKGLLAKVLGA